MRYQLQYILGALLCLPFFPFLFWQGIRVRKSVTPLPEAGGPKAGTEGIGARPLHLLVLGESTMAGVGVSNHREGFTGHLAALLHQYSGRPVHWQVIARSGFTAREVAEQLVPAIPSKAFDIIVIGLGGNDTFQLNAPMRWRWAMIQLVQDLRKRQPQCGVVIISLPPVGDFPALPGSLRFVLGSLVQLHARAIRSLPYLFERVYYKPTPISFKNWKSRLPEGAPPAAFFSDGVHPSGLTYRLWAEETLEFMQDSGLI